MWEEEHLRAAGRQVGAGRTAAPLTPGTARAPRPPACPPSVSAKSTAQPLHGPSLRKKIQFPLEVGFSSRTADKGDCCCRVIKTLQRNEAPARQLPVFSLSVSTGGQQWDRKSCATGSSCGHLRSLGQGPALSPAPGTWHCHFLCLHNPCSIPFWRLGRCPPSGWPPRTQELQSAGEEAPGGWEGAARVSLGGGGADRENQLPGSPLSPGSRRALSPQITCVHWVVTVEPPCRAQRCPFLAATLGPADPFSRPQPALP